MTTIDPRPLPRPGLPMLDLPLLPPLWRRIVIDLNCKTRILFLTDGLSHDSTGFGLEEARNIVAAAATTNHDIEITTANWLVDPGADVDQFRFAGTHTVGTETRTIEYYEEIWIFALASANDVASSMGGADLTALTDFMDNGGGVFATGDHDELGAYLCGPVPRVGSMRLWYESDGAPDGTDADSRIDTNVPNGGAGADFDLQSDSIPQRIYPKWYVDGGATLPHELLARHDVDGTVAFLPDHPHEGRVVEPASLDPDEYPDGIGPEIVAWGVSAGPGTGFKPPVAPELFGVIGAYDGHQAGVGRIVVDSTWHHWININLNGAGAGGLAGGVATDGLYSGAAPTPEYLQIQQYFQNIAGWLEPTQLRICSIIIWWPCLRWAWPLVQNVDFRREPSFGDLVEVGQSIIGTMRGRRGGTPEELVNLLTSELDIPDELRAYLDPRWVRTRKLRRRLEVTPLVDRSKVVAAVIGGSMWTLANEMPDTEHESAEWVRKMLAVDGDRHDHTALFELMQKGTKQGLDMLANELQRRSNGMDRLRKAAG